MSDEDEFLKKVSEEEQRHYEELEQYHYDEIFSIFKNSLENSKNISKETLDNNFSDIEELIKIISKYEMWLFNSDTYPYKMEKTQSFSIKLSEIIATLNDILFLLIIGMYNASRVLIRKFMELSISSVYMDAKETRDKIKKLWINSEDIWDKVTFDKKLTLGNRIKEVSNFNSKIHDRVKQIYKELSMYVHNEGKNNLYLLYDKDQFLEIFKIICEVDELIQKILNENYKNMKK